jgi:EmrB/QacA subfamily drug resistance transporter
VAAVVDRATHAAERVRARRDRLDPKLVVAVVYVSAMFVNIMDTTIVIVALPKLGDDLDVGTASIEWVVIGYLLSLAVWIPASGWIGDRFGTKRTFLAALAVFTVASMLCGVATSLGQLVAFRVLQGVGGGMLTPVGTAMLFRAFPPEERARAARILIVPTVAAPALGPIVGGLLVDELSWRWIFFVNLPIGVAAFVFGARYLVEHREPTAGRFDGPGFVLSGAGLALVLYALSEAPSAGWAAPEVLVTGLGGVAALVALVRVELRSREPMLHLRLLEERLFRATNLTSLFAYGAFIALLFILPIYLQEARGLSALESGATTFPEAIGVLVSSQLVARLYPVVGPRRLMAGGLVGVASTMFLLAGVDVDTSLWLIRGVMFVAGFSMAYVFISLQAATFAQVSPQDTGRASAIFNTQRQGSAALGVAVLATVLASQLDGRAPADDLSAFRVVFIVDACIALAGVVVALVAIRDVDAAPSMRRKAEVQADADVAAVAH